MSLDIIPERVYTIQGATMTRRTGGSEPVMMQQLRDAIQADGRSQNSIAKAAGMDNSRVSRFVRGERKLDFESAAKLCEVLGITFALPAAQLVAAAPAKKTSRGKK